MVIIKTVGTTIKREHTPLYLIFDVLNDLVSEEIIKGYLVSIRGTDVVINIIERG